MSGKNSVLKSIVSVFLGDTPSWYKYTIIIFLIANPIIMFTAGAKVAAWILLAEFLFTLITALYCYPLPPAGLLVIQAVMLGLTTADNIYAEVEANFPVLLLLMFMVAGIHFMKDIIRLAFTLVLVKVRSKLLLSLMFAFMSAFLSAFLDSLTVVAVIIAVSYGFYEVYSKTLFAKPTLTSEDEAEYEQFKGFLKNILMHAAAGTVMGGTFTIVGEPQNLLIGKTMGWEFADFFFNCAPVMLPVLIIGLITCALVEVTGFLGYGKKLPDNVYEILKSTVNKQLSLFDNKAWVKLAFQGIVAGLLILALGFHIAEIGLVGLMVIVLATSFTGITEEHKFGESFMEALPFTALLVVFFGVVAVIHDQQLFTPMINKVLTLEGTKQLAMLYVVNGVLSSVSDSVFVATIFISEMKDAYIAGVFPSKEWFDKVGVVINVGTNIPSVSTPNGQAAFLFLLTSSLAKMIRLSYFEMLKLAIPYTITLTGTGLLGIIFIL